MEPRDNEAVIVALTLGVVPAVPVELLLKVAEIVRLVVAAALVLAVTAGDVLTAALVLAVVAGDAAAELAATERVDVGETVTVAVLVADVAASLIANFKL